MKQRRQLYSYYKQAKLGDAHTALAQFIATQTTKRAKEVEGRALGERRRTSHGELATE